MAFLVYFLIPLLAYVFIPRAAASQDVSGNPGSDERNLDIAGGTVETPNTGHGDAVHPQHEEARRHPRTRIRHSRYRSERRRHLENDKESPDIFNNEGIAPIETEITTEGQNAHEATTRSYDSDTSTNIQDGLPEDEAERDHADEGITDPQVADDERQDNATYDSIENSAIENSVTEQTDQHEYEKAPNPMSCPKCGSKEEQERLHVEIFKQTILSKLGMKTAPKVEGPLPPLPFDFYLGEDFTVSDEPEDEDNDKSSVKTREMFIFGTDGKWLYSFFHIFMFYWKCRHIYISLIS